MCLTRGRAIAGPKFLASCQYWQPVASFTTSSVKVVSQATFLTHFYETVELTGFDMATDVLDNAPCHRRVRQVALGENHAIRFLTAYSPFLNIMENAWSTWKAAFKQELAELRP